MKTSNIVLIIIIMILLAANIYVFTQWLSAGAELKSLNNSMKVQQFNGKIVDFAKLFVQKVLKSNAVVSFEDRMKLENSVRDLNDEAILAQWQKFTGSKTEKEAQTELNNLLEVLIGKIKY